MKIRRYVAIMTALTVTLSALPFYSAETNVLGGEAEDLLFEEIPEAGDGEGTTYTVDGYDWGFDISSGTITFVPDKWAGGTVPAQISGTKVTAIGEKAGRYNKNILSLEIPEGVESIGEDAFAGCTNLESLKLPESLKTIGASALSGCEQLSDIDFGGGRKSIDETGIICGERALKGVLYNHPDFSAPYKSSGYYRKLQDLELTGDFVEDVFLIAKSQEGYHQGDTFAELDGSNKNGDDQYAEPNYFKETPDWFWHPDNYPDKYQYGGWCGLFCQWAYALAGAPDEVMDVFAYRHQTDHGWDTTVYAGNEDGYELKHGDLIHFEYGHYALVDYVEWDKGADTLKIYSWNGNPDVAYECHEVQASTGKCDDADKYPNHRLAWYVTVEPEAAPEKAERFITFDPAGGTVGVSSKRVYNGAYYGILPDPVREGYTFDGWYSRPNGEGRMISAYRQVRLMDDAVIYAKWLDDKGNTAEDYSGEIPSEDMTDPGEKTEAVQPVAQDIVNYEVAGGKIRFEKNSGTVTGADKTITEADIPSQIGGTDVKAIGTWAFYEIPTLTKVTLPDTLKKLDKGAFYGCGAITEMDIPEGVESIGEMAFYNCRGLRKISLPSTLRRIERSAFYQAEELSAGEGLEYVDIPGGIQYIGDYAFYGCAGLKGVAFVKGSSPECGNMVFDKCYKLEKVVNSPIVKWNQFIKSCKRAIKYLDTDEMREKQSEMWRLDTDDQKKAVTATAQEITADCSTDLERALAISKWIDDHIDYERGNDNSAWAVYTGIMEKIAAGKGEMQYNSCGGYSNLTQVMMQSLGIPCATVWRQARNGESIDHEFNMAYFDGKWRWLDNTASNCVWVDAGTAGFAADSDHRVDYLLYDSGDEFYIEIPTDIAVEEDVKDWPAQNKSEEAYAAGEGYKDPDFEHEIDEDEKKAEEDKVAALKTELESAFASEPETASDSFEYEIKDGGVVITGLKNSAKSLTKIKIPEKLGGYPVIKLDGVHTLEDKRDDDGPVHKVDKVTSAFSGCNALRYLYIPDSVDTICSGCFQNLRKLELVHLPEGLTEIPGYGFYGCDSLEKIIVPEKVSRLGPQIFDNCDSLKEVLFEDFSFKEKVRATDRMGSNENYENGEADINWYCFQGAGTALYGHDFDASYIGTKYHRALQKAERTSDWRRNIRNVLYSQLGYREGFSPYHLEGTNTKPFKTAASAAFWEWGHFAESGRFEGVNGTTWCAAFVDWAWSMAGISPDYENSSNTVEFGWEDTVYAGSPKAKEIKMGDVIGVGKTHVAMAEKAVIYDEDYVKLTIMQGNALDRQVCTEVVYYDKVTGAAIPVDESTGKPYKFDRDKEKLILDETKAEDLRVKSSYGSYRDKYDLRYICQTDFLDIKYHTITFDPGDGEVAEKSRIFTDGAYYGALPDATRRDYVFDGWYTEQDGGVKCLPYDRAGSEDVTLYAHYHHDPLAVKKLTLSRSKTTVRVEGTRALQAVISPENASDKKVIWRSGNDEVVTVKDGVLTGVKEGNATVFARAEGGPYVAYCEVTVEKKESSSGGGSGSGSGSGSGQTQQLVTYAVEGGSINFDKNSGTIVSAEKTVTKAVIPASIDGVAVKTIGKEAFYQCHDLKEVLLPEGLEVIGQSAFEETALTSVTIPDSVKRLEKWSFCVIETLEYVIMGSGIEYLGQWAFSKDKKLKTVYFKENWDDVTLDGQVFTSNPTMKLYDAGTDPAGQVSNPEESGKGSGSGSGSSSDSGKTGSSSGGSSSGSGKEGSSSGGGKDSMDSSSVKDGSDSGGGKDDSGSGSGKGSTESSSVKDSTGTEDGPGVSENAVVRVPPTGNNTYASEKDNLAPVADSGNITKLVMDFSNVAASKVDPGALKMTVLKGSKFTTRTALKDISSAKSRGGIKVKVNKKTLIPTITCKSDGSVTLTMESGDTYTVEIRVESPKAVKSAKTMKTDATAAVRLSVKDLFGTELTGGTLSILSEKVPQATVTAGNILEVRPALADSIKLQYMYLNRKFKITIKVK